MTQKNITFSLKLLKSNCDIRLICHLIYSVKPNVVLVTIRTITVHRREKLWQRVIGGTTVLEKRHLSPSIENLHEYKEKIGGKSSGECIRIVKPSFQQLSHMLCFDLGNFCGNSVYSVHSIWMGDL